MRDDLELLNRVDDRRHGVGAEKCGEVVHPIRQEIIAAVGCAIDGRKRESSPLGDWRCEAAGPAAHVVLADTDRRHAGSQRKKLCKVASVQGKVIHLLGRDDRSKLCAGDLQLFGCSLNTYDLGLSASRQEHINRGRLIHGKYEIGNLFSAETRRAHFHGVPAGIDVRENIRAGVVAKRTVLDSRVGVAQNH